MTDVTEGAAAPESAASEIDASKARRSNIDAPKFYDGMPHPVTKAALIADDHDSGATSG